MFIYIEGWANVNTIMNLRLNKRWGILSLAAYKDSMPYS